MSALESAFLLVTEAAQLGYWIQLAGPALQPDAWHAIVWRDGSNTVLYSGWSETPAGAITKALRQAMQSEIT